MILTDGIELYHASYTAVEKIDLSLCAAGKDFGKGFYVTTDYSQACRFIRTAIGNIAGKIANDSTNQILSAYINGFYGEVGSYEADETAIKFLLPNNLSDQICFRTENALQNLHFKGYRTVKLED